MREVNLLNQTDNRFVRALVLGAPKSGKTHFAASAPEPLFISDAAEGGYETIRSMDRALWWDSERQPVVWAIEDAFADINPTLAKLEKLKAEGRFPYRTIVIDPLSIYADRVLAEMIQRASQGGKSVDNRAMYGDLANHLRVILLRFHALPAHILWLCHIKEGGVALAGQTADKLPAFMDHIWLCTVQPGLNDSNYELHTKPFGPYQLLGGRWTTPDKNGKRWGLPSPTIPSFKHIARIMNLGEPVSPAMPGYPEGFPPPGYKYQWPPET